MEKFKKVQNVFFRPSMLSEVKYALPKENDQMGRITVLINNNTYFTLTREEFLELRPELDKHLTRLGTTFVNMEKAMAIVIDTSKQQPRLKIIFERDCWVTAPMNTVAEIKDYLDIDPSDLKMPPPAPPAPPANVKQFPVNSMGKGETLSPAMKDRLLQSQEVAPPQPVNPMEAPDGEDGTEDKKED